MKNWGEKVNNPFNSLFTFRLSNEISCHYDRISLSLQRFIKYINSVAVPSMTIFDLPSKHSCLGILKVYLLHEVTL